MKPSLPLEGGWKKEKEWIKSSRIHEKQKSRTGQKLWLNEQQRASSLPERFQTVRARTRDRVGNRSLPSSFPPLFLSFLRFGGRTSRESSYSFFLFSLSINCELGVHRGGWSVIRRFMRGISCVCGFLERYAYNISATG